MKVKIIKENENYPHSWYNELKPFKMPSGKMSSGIKSKVGEIFEVTNEGDHYKTVKKVFGGRTRGLIDKEDCEVIES